MSQHSVFAKLYSSGNALCHGLLVSCDVNRKRMYASAGELSGSQGVCS